MAPKKVPVVVPVVPVVDVPVVSAAKVSKAKVEKVVAKKPPVAEVIVEPPVPDEIVVVDSPLILLEEKLAQLSVAFKEVNVQVRVVKKEMDRLRRIADRVEKKKANAKSQPSGFARPCLISDELCTFLDAPKGSEKSRTEVTREIHKYVKAKDLSDPTNKRIILAHKDAKLKEILNSSDDTEISYFNLQKYLKHHFIKPVPVVA